MTPQQPQPAHGSCQGILDNWNPRKIALASGAVRSGVGGQLES